MAVWGGCESESVVEVADGVAHVFLDQVGVDGDGCCGTGAGGGDDLGARVDDVPGSPNTGDTGARGGVDGDPAVGVDVAAKADQQGAVRDEAGWDEQCVHRNDAAVAHLHASQLVLIVDDELVDGAFDDGNVAGEQLGSIDGGQRVGRSEVGEVVGPLPNDLRVSRGAGGSADDAEPPVADLMAVAVRAVQNISGPPVTQSGGAGQLVAQAGGDQHSPSGDPLPTGEAVSYTHLRAHET